MKDKRCPMRYREFKPRLPLAEHVECFWTVQGDQLNPGQSAAQRILPDGCIEIIFHLADRVRRYSTDQKSDLQPVSFVSGPTKRFILIEPTGRYETFGVRFRPGMLFPFLRVPLNELTEMSVRLSDIWGVDGAELTGQVLAAKNHRDRMALVETFLIGQWDESYEVNTIVRMAISTILRTAGRVSVEQLIRDLKISSRQLERNFNQTVGVTPKVFSRIVRFQKIFKVLDSAHSPRFTAVAFECGYYDQAHFIKEFKQFTGQKPSTYFSYKHPMSDFFTSKERMSNFYNSVVV